MVEYGKLKSEYTIEDGRQNGTSYIWYQSGQLEIKEFYENDIMLSYKTWYENGMPKKEFNYNEEGQLDGSISQWYETGKPSFEAVYFNGMKNGVHRRWHENGNIEEYSFYKNDKLNGTRYVWHMNGQLIEQSNWKDGVRID